jgi:hypothetical protein
MAKTTKTSQKTASSELAQALVEAINITKPEAKRTISTRKKNTPWTPKDGSPKLKLKRKSHLHGILQVESRLSNEEIDLLNKVKPGVYCDGYVKVLRRKDRGIDIDYPVRTASQRLRLINDYGIVSFKTLLEHLVTEGVNPKKVETEEVDE